MTQLNWSNHLKIMSACKSMDERVFYMNMCIKERLSKRELARQIDSGYYERYMLSQKPIALAIDESKQATGNIFLDNYVLDFLDVPDTVSEHDLQKSIIRNLKDFILEIGRDFTFIGEEYRVQVGNHDYYIRCRDTIWMRSNRKEIELKKKNDEVTIRSSAAEYLTYVASVGD